MICATNALPGCCPDGHLARRLPFPWDLCGRYDIAVIRELLAKDCTFPVSLDDLPVDQLAEFRPVADLQRQVQERMRAIAAEDLATPCKLANIVFSSTEVQDRGEVVHKAESRLGSLWRSATT